MKRVILPVIMLVLLVLTAFKEEPESDFDKKYNAYGLTHNCIPRNLGMYYSAKTPAKMLEDLGPGYKVTLKDSAMLFVPGYRSSAYVVYGEAFIMLDSAITGGKEFTFEAGHGIFKAKHGVFNIIAPLFSEDEFDEKKDSVTSTRITVLSGKVLTNACGNRSGGVWIDGKHDAIAFSEGSLRILMNEKPLCIDWYKDSLLNKMPLIK